MSHHRTNLTSGWQLLLLVALSAAVVAGCGSPLTPEQKAAITKVQRMGGKINVHTADTRSTCADRTSRTTSWLP